MSLLCFIFFYFYQHLHSILHSDLFPSIKWDLTYSSYHAIGPFRMILLILDIYLHLLIPILFRFDNIQVQGSTKHLASKFLEFLTLFLNTDSDNYTIFILVDSGLEAKFFIRKLVKGVGQQPFEHSFDFERVLLKQRCYHLLINLFGITVWVADKLFQ